MIFSFSLNNVYDNFLFSFTVLILPEKPKSPLKVRLHEFGHPEILSNGSSLFKFGSFKLNSSIILLKVDLLEVKASLHLGIPVHIILFSKSLIISLSEKFSKTLIISSPFKSKIIIS